MKPYRMPLPDLSARARLTVPLDDYPAARLLGCSWDNARQSWWVDRTSTAGTAYVGQGMEFGDPMRKAAWKACR